MGVSGSRDKAHGRGFNEFSPNGVLDEIFNTFGKLCHTTNACIISTILRFTDVNEKTNYKINVTTSTINDNKWKHC